MSTQFPLGVLVGVDGSAGSDNAVRYGALAAGRLGVQLTLVHVLPAYVPPAPTPLVQDDLAAAGHAIAGQARQVAEPYIDGTTVVTLVPTGSTTGALAELSARAELVVLGHNTRTHLGRLFTGAVTAGVAARSACPVVTVPDSWDHNSTTGEVVVGIKHALHAEGLLERAFATAEARGARLTLIHAWELPSVYDDIIVRRTHDTDWSVRAQEQVAPRLDELRARYPAVPVEVTIVHGQPAHALVEAAAGADLLMLERRGGRLPAGLHLGSTARAVLREASCPVEVAPPRGALIDTGNFDLEGAGAPMM